MYFVPDRGPNAIRNKGKGVKKMEVFVLVPRKKSVWIELLSSVVLALGVATLLMSCANTVLLPFAVIFIALWYFLQFRSNVEYEYSYFDGEVRFARVTNKSRRKALKNYDMGSILAIAPAHDASVQRYESDNSIKVKDYTSRRNGVNYYDIIAKDTDNVVLYKAELDEKFLDAVCIKYASKVVRGK